MTRLFVPHAHRAWLFCVAWLGVFVLVLSAASFSHAQILGRHTIADLADKVTPAVVSIRTVSVQSNQRQFPFSFPPGSPFEEFFRRRFQDGVPQQERRSIAQGSGFLIDQSGVVVTNNHVIENAESVIVITHNGTEYNAKRIGVDPLTDLALLKIDSEDKFPALEWGDSDVIRIGELVVAIGNPYGFGGSVTSGIISARGRNIGAGPYVDFLQTDAPINRGNSGGPLFNLDGAIIGVNTAIVSPDGGSIGIGFAIPSNIARDVVSQLQSYGETRRGWLGVVIQALDQPIAESLGLESTEGVLIQDVSSDSPAERAGIKPGDVVLSFSRRPIRSPRELQIIVAETEVNSTVPIEVWREGRKRRLRVTLGRLEEAEIVAGRGGGGESFSQNEGGRFAARFKDLTLSLMVVDEAARQRLGIDVNGLLVEKVEGVADSGLRPVRVLLPDGNYRFIGLRLRKG